MNCSNSTNTRGNSNLIKLQIRRSRFLRMAPLIIWALAVFLPMLVGSRLYFASLQQQQQEIAAQTRQLLMTRLQQFMARLNPDQIAQSFFTMYDYQARYAEYILQRSPEDFTNMPIVRALPDFGQDIDRELASFSSYLTREYNVTPDFLLALDENATRCGMLLRERLRVDSQTAATLRGELAQMAKNLNLTTTYSANLPGELKHYRDFPAFNQILGISHYFNTRFWRVDGRFSGKLNQRIYLVTMRYPSQAGSGNCLLAGFAADSIPQMHLLKKISTELSDDQLTVRTGYSSDKDFPVFIEKAGKLAVINKLPAVFTNISAGSGKNLVVSVSQDSQSAFRQLRRKIDSVNLLLLIAGSLSLLFAAGISLGRLKLTAKLTQIIAASFISCMLFPLTAVFWLGLLQNRTSSETDVQQTMQMISQKIGELDQSFLLLSYRRMFLLKEIAQYLEQLPMESWERFVRYMFLPEAKRRFSRQFSSYYLYSSNDREYYKGQGPGEKQSEAEISRLFVGASRKLMIQTDAMSELSASNRERISQLADFASGLMDQLMRPNLLNELYRTQGGLFLSDFMARRFLYCSHFLRRNSKIIGYMIFTTDNLLIVDMIADVVEKRLMPAEFSINDYQVELIFYPVEDYDERGLLGRADFRGDRAPANTDRYREIANAVYASADFNQINNLHMRDPHLIVSDRIFNGYVFAFAIARPQSRKNSTRLPLALLFAVAITSCLLLGTGVAHLLLLQIPPFLSAMREVENDSYDWQLNLPGTDEFAELAGSINEMRVSLLERKKMMQLVSADAIEAARSDLRDQLTARRRAAVILFCDIRSFTTISESRSAEEVVEMLNSYFSCMCPIIEQHGGFVDKLIGDAIQAAFYGNSETALLAAGRAALQMRSSLAAFNAERANNQQFAIDNGIGIASGMVVTGLVGSQSGKLDATLFGNVLNQARELEAKSKHARTTKILLAADTWHQISDLVCVEQINIVDSADGESATQPLYELISLSDKVS
jgi:class 3 adenylate cyclase